MHIFAIGDWGGMDGSLDTNEGRPNIVAYDWGKRPGPSVFPRSRWNKAHTVKLCASERMDKIFCSPQREFFAFHKACRTGKNR